MSDSDLRLMRRVAQGEARAVREMIAMSAPRVYSLSWRMLRDATEAEDVAQEAMMRAVEQAPRWYDGGARINTWLHKVTLNLCRDRLRKRREVLVDQIPDGKDPAANPECELLDTETIRLVAAAVHALPDRQREAIILVHYQGLSGNEAAKALDVSIEALESLLSRGRRTLKARFLKQENDDD